MARPIHRQEKALFPHITQVSLPLHTNIANATIKGSLQANTTSKADFFRLGGLPRYPKKSAKLQNGFITNSGLGAIVCISALYCCPYSLQISIEQFQSFLKLPSFVRRLSLG